MSHPIIDFESSREKEKKRQQEREARNYILEKAKNEFEVRKAREEVARQRGEHTWMLSSVEANLDSSKKKKKKKEKKKKKKKEKKAKKSKKHDSSSSSSSSEDEEGAWVEKSTPSASIPASVKETTEQESSAPQGKRDGWMEMTSLFGTFTRDEMREREGTCRKKAKEEEEARKREANKPGSHARELNPYFKNGGTGLPEEEPQQKVSVGLDAAWLRRALQRAKEQAEKENKSLEEVAAQRWGSLAKFHELLAEAEGRGRSRQEEPWQQGRRNRDRLDDRHGDRRRSRSREKSRRDQRSRSRERQRRSRSRERQRRSRSRERRRSRSRSRDRQRRSRSREYDRRKEKSRHRRYSSSSSSSDSESDSRSRSGSRKREDMRRPKESQEDREGGIRNIKGLLKPPSDDSVHDKHSSSLASRFQKPGEGNSFRNMSSASSSSSRGWQKKQRPQEESQRERTASRKPVSSSSSSSSSSESEEEPPQKVENIREKERVEETVTEGPAPQAKLLTDKEMNELAAKIMKAELIGNEPQAAKLKKKLEVARAARASAPQGSREDDEAQTKEEVVVLTRMDARGECGEKERVEETVTEGPAPQAKLLTDKEMNELAAKIMKAELIGNEPQAAKLKKKLEVARAARASAPQGSREDDEAQTKEEVVVLTRMDARGVCRPVSGSVEKGDGKRKKKMKTHDKDGQRTKYFPDDDQYDLKRMFEKEKGTSAADQNSLFERSAMHNSEKLNEEYDLDDMFMSKAVQKESSAKQAERDRQKAIDDLRKSLVRMFNSRDEDCIFFETVKRLRNYPHMVINCVPLPKEMGDMAPIYFKKAIMECEAEWAQNKKLVDLKNRSVRSAVPKGLPYFFVDFAMDPGYAHVIEDEQDFPHNFAQEIVGGMLDLENNLWRKPRKENFDQQRRKVMEFGGWYKEFDPTQDN
ncbi:CWF19-like protein 2 [Penaeus indicus]|uniref:CWF19-like protein 2 n=1 Tax=Penaeus indicus TaxID=29960 RepID=UPI00300C73DC